MPEPSTPPATEAAAQTRDVGAAPAQARKAPRYQGFGKDYLVGPGVTRAHTTEPYDRRPDDPVYRPLRVYALDPTVSVVEGATAILNVPYEPLGKGPAGSVLEVLGLDGDIAVTRVDLDDPKVLIDSGLQPSPTNHLFHQQMVYAVASSVYAAFRVALGRHLAWGFDGKLRIRAHVPDMQNAYYEPASGTLSFGYYPAPENTKGDIPPGSLVFTCLSHDIVVHELTHALLDGLRAQFMVPTGPDVPAFHEAFADLIAILQHFTYKEVLEKEIQKARGNLEQAGLLTGIAREFGYTLGADKPLRSAIDMERRLKYGETEEAYELGSVLVSAIFEAFTEIYRRKTERYIRLATGGTGILRPGNLPADLVSVLAEQASKLAGQFLSIAIRALDYCPPIGIEFGEYLRAMITADRDLVPDDNWGYRESLIRSFARRRIYPRDVRNLSEDALVWRAPRKPVPPLDPLQFSELRFAGDPSCPAGAEELMRQACALGQFISRPEQLDNFGFVTLGDPRLGGDAVDPPRVESIRTSRRVGPSGQVLFDLVAEVTQRRTAKHPDTGLLTEFWGGVTVILGPKGEVRYTVLKHVLNEDRLRRQFDYQRTAGLWKPKDGRLVPDEKLFELMHRGRR